MTPSAFARRRRLAAATAGFATFLNLYTPQAILPVLAADFGMSLPHTSLAVTVALFAVAAMAPVAGAISDRLGRRRLIVGAAWLISVPTLLAAAAPDFPTLLVWRFVQGLMLPFIFAVTVAYIGEETEGAETLRATGLYASGTIVGGFSGRFLTGIVAEFAGWRGAFVALAVVTAISALIVAFAMPRETRFQPLRGGLGATLEGYASHLANPRLLGTCAVGFGMLFSLVASFTFVNFRLAGAPFLLSPAQLGSVFATYLLGAVAAPTASYVVARVGRRATMLVAVAAGIVGQALTLLPSLVAIVAGLGATCVALFVAQALSLSFIGATVTRARSAAVGLYVTVYYTGGALGGLAPIWLWLHGGWPAIVALVVAMMLAMAATAMAAWRVASDTAARLPN